MVRHVAPLLALALLLLSLGEKLVAQTAALCARMRPLAPSRMRWPWPKCSGLPGAIQKPGAPNLLTPHKTHPFTTGQRCGGTARLTTRHQHLRAVRQGSLHR